MPTLRQSVFVTLFAGLGLAHVALGAETGAQIAKSGSAAGAPACVTCHGVAGQGQRAAGFPRLAGLNAAYFAAQLHGFQDGTRANPIMGPVAKLLSAADVKALATYYASLAAIDATRDSATSGPVVAAGETLASKGDWKNGVPACAQCHGATGLGVGAAFPQIAGQSVTYISNQLLAWKADTRKNDPMGLMHGIAVKLSAADVSAVAAYYAALPVAITFAAHDDPGGPILLAQATSASTPARTVVAPAAGVPPVSGASAPLFQPPADSAIPNNDFGREVKLGQAIFNGTSPLAAPFIGNSLRCASCHLDAGKLPHSAPLWSAYLTYPAYRSKNGHVNTLAERFQGCFTYSMNGTAPPLGGKVLVALETYSFFLAKGAPVGAKLAGRGYPTLPKPALAMDFNRGAKVFNLKCALCHAADGQGQSSNGNVVFPPLWGPKSFNWGAGMGSAKNAAGFIKANMPLSQGNTLSDQEAWDVAMFMDSHERPQDPRFKGSIADTRKRHHNSPFDMYGQTVNGQLLGKGSAPSPKS